MATKFKEIEGYEITNWHNYNPPSIDQINLLHIEQNIELNRETINAIIRRLGAVPESGLSKEDQAIYDNSIYKTLIDHKNLIAQLDDKKLDKTIYNDEIKKIQSQIDNRLRKDIDDSSNFGYTFKKLALTQTLSVGTTSTFSGDVTMSSALTVTGKVYANDGLETTTFKATDNVTLSKALSVTGATTLSGGATIKNGATITGTLTVDKLVVTGAIECASGITCTGGSISIKEGSLTAKGSLTTTEGELRTNKNYINMAYGQNIKHTLWVQGAVPSLGGGDAVIVTVQ